MLRRGFGRRLQPPPTGVSDNTVLPTRLSSFRESSHARFVWTRPLHRFRFDGARGKGLVFLGSAGPTDRYLARYFCAAMAPPCFLAEPSLVRTLTPFPSGGGRRASGGL